MPRRLIYTLLTTVVAAALATSPALAKPLTAGLAAPSPRTDSDHAYSRDLFYRTDDAFNIHSIPPATPTPAKPTLATDTPIDDADSNGPLLFGIVLATAGVVVLITNWRGRPASP